MSVLSQLMKPEDFVKLDESTAGRLEAATSQLVVTDQNKAALTNSVAGLVQSLPTS